jgi:hypothetical protein
MTNSQNAPVMPSTPVFAHLLAFPGEYALHADSHTLNSELLYATSIFEKKHVQILCTARTAQPTLPSAT